MARPGWYRSHRLRHCVRFCERYDTDKLTAAIQWLEGDHRSLRGAYTIIGISDIVDENDLPIAVNYEFRFSDADTAFAFKMRWS